MTPLEIKAARLALGMNQREFAEALRAGGEAVVRSWESGRRKISGPTTVAIECLLNHGPFAPIETRQGGDAKQGSVAKP